MKGTERDLEFELAARDPARDQARRATLGMAQFWVLLQHHVLQVPGRQTFSRSRHPE